MVELKKQTNDSVSFKITWVEKMGTKQLTKGNSREKFLRMEKATIRASE